MLGNESGGVAERLGVVTDVSRCQEMSREGSAGGQGIKNRGEAGERWRTGDLWIGGDGEESS